MRFHAENPELTLEELMTKLGSVPAKVRANEPRHRYECRSCGSEMFLNTADHARYEANKISGQGFTIPKCGDCWS